MNPEEENLEEADVNVAVSSLMQELPKAVQDFLASDERGSVVRELSSKYSLHVDQAGEFERAFLFMLLGISKPEEFVATLTQTGLSQDVVNGLATDMNTRVFMRLREAERQQAAQASLSPQAPLPPPALDYQPASAPTLPGSPVAAPMPVQTAPTPIPMAATLEPAPVPQPPEPEQHVVHAMPSTPQQGWHPAAAVHIFVPTHGAHMQPQSAPFVPAPAPEASVAPVQQALYVNPQTEMPGSMPDTAAKPLTKDYVADPYREPVQ